jgi:hypothetical protein
MKDFGAGFEMQERLAVFKELNAIRTICRVTYSICFVSSPSIYPLPESEGRDTDT